MSFADQATTPDQARIADALPSLLEGRSRILHVGVGNSELAATLANRVAHIEGITVVPDELAAAVALKLANYHVTLLNKHSPRLAQLPSPFDVIIDNNPGSFACCQLHFGRTLQTYASMLAPQGHIMTDERGARWRQRGGLSLRWKGWVAWGERYNLVAKRVTDSVWSLGLANPSPIR